MTFIPVKIREAYGNLPTEWKLEKLKFFVDVRNSNVDKKIDENEISVRLCNYTDVYYNDKINRDISFMEGSATEVEIQKLQLKSGQVIITKDSEAWEDIGIPSLVVEDMPDVVCGYHLSVLEPGPDILGRYLAWLCRSAPLNDQFKTSANGVTRYGLGQYPMKNAFICIPPLEIQGSIANFLDEKTEYILGIINKTTGRILGTKALRDLSEHKDSSLCGRLMEYRNTLITAAVTGKIEQLR